MSAPTGESIKPDASILHNQEVQQHLERLRQEHARRVGSTPLLPLPYYKRKVNKTITTIRLSPDVLSAFKSTGKGWQTRMDAALKRLVAEGNI